MIRRSSLVMCVAAFVMASCTPMGGDKEVEATILVVKKTPNDVLAPNTPQPRATDPQSADRPRARLCTGRTSVPSYRSPVPPPATRHTSTGSAISVRTTAVVA